MAERDSDIGAFITGFVVGGLVGAAVALLLAPQSGEETRTLIRDKSIELRDQATQTATDVRARAERLAQDARTKAEDLQRRGQMVLEEQKSRLEQPSRPASAPLAAGRAKRNRRKPSAPSAPGLQSSGMEVRGDARGRPLAFSRGTRSRAPFRGLEPHR